MTFAVLRALHAIVGDALDDIERIYADGGPPHSSLRQQSRQSDFAYASPPPSPSNPHFSSASPLDFPSLDLPYDPTSPSEALISHPVVVTAINQLVAAAGQISATVQVPFITICDAAMAYHLPSCLRLLEASHTLELLREAGPSGMHVDSIARRNRVEKDKLAHALRLLATHHLLREVSPNVFAANRISSLLDTGKPFDQLKRCPESKYEGTDGTAAFVGLCTDELFKSSAYLTEAYFLSSDAPENGDDPTQAPFNYAFNCHGFGFFGWLEGEGMVADQHLLPRRPNDPNPNQFRLERFGKAMSGTDGWEVPGAILNGFDWQSLPRGSTIVDVGGGIGSTSMLLATAFDENFGFKFIIQDRQVVVDMGVKAWQGKCPHFLDEGVAQFEAHDFFTPQPARDVSLFLIRVILHDWPDSYAKKLLLRLRDAAGEHTKLLIADFVVPLACVDNEEIGVEGAERTLAPSPLLPNLGKASANVYSMDLTMQCAFNSQERTLREVINLCRSTGWKVVKVKKAPGSLFGHMTAVPVDIPLMGLSRGFAWPREEAGMDVRRCTTPTPTFGSRMELPSTEETSRAMRFGGGLMRGLRKLTSPISSRKSKLPMVPESPSRPVAESPARTRRSSHASRLSLKPSAAQLQQRSPPPMPSFMLSVSNVQQDSPPPPSPSTRSLGERPSASLSPPPHFTTSSPPSPSARSFGELPMPSLSPPPHIVPSSSQTKNRIRRSRSSNLLGDPMYDGGVAASPSASTYSLANSDSPSSSHHTTGGATTFPFLSRIPNSPLRRSARSLVPVPPSPQPQHQITRTKSYAQLFPGRKRSESTASALSIGKAGSSILRTLRGSKDGHGRSPSVDDGQGDDNGPY